MPDDKAPKTKNLIPDSADCNESRLIEARTYNAKLCNSIPRYIDIKLFDPIRTNIPKVEKRINTGISNLNNFISL